MLKIFHPNIFKPIHTSYKHAQTSTQTHFQTYHYDVENNHVGWKLKVISNLNSPSIILKHYLKNCPCASISILFLPQSLSMPLFQICSCPFPFLCLCFNFVFATILFMYLFFILLPFASFYHLSLCLLFFFLYFILSLCVSNFFVVFLFIHCLLSICWLFSLFFSTLILNCPCMSLFSSLSNLILLFASSLTLSKLVYDVTNDHQKLSIAKVNQILPWWTINNYLWLAKKNQLNMKIIISYWIKI